jgi:chaperonin GroEL
VRSRTNQTARLGRRLHAGRRGAFNAQTETYENLVQAGVIDPTRVVRSALQNTASIASVLLTTEAVITQIPEKNRDAAMPGNGMGAGMY